MENCNYRILLITIFMLLSCSVKVVFANVKSFQHLTAQDGLPHQQVEKLMEDDRGRLWMATRNGVCYYNGYEVVTFFHDPSNPNSLNHNFAVSLFQDSKQRIWIGTYAGISRYRPETYDFYSYGDSKFQISSIIETSDGKIITGGTELSMYDEESDSFICLNNELGYIISMVVDSRNRILIATNEAIYYYTLSQNRTTQISPLIFRDFLSGYDGIIPMFIDSNDHVWIGRNGKGVMSLDSDLTNPKIWEANKLSNGTVRAICEDESGAIWLGTEKGISVIDKDGSVEFIFQDFVNQTKINDNAVYSIIRDKNNNIWIGTYFGGVNVMFKNHEKFAWLRAGYSDSALSGKVVRRIIEVKKNVFWLATEDGGVNTYNLESGKVKKMAISPCINDNIHDLFFDSDKNEMWIGTFRSGLFSYSINGGRTRQFLPKDNNGLPSDAIFSIVKQANGTLWIGTTQGLRIYDEASNKFEKINHPILDVDFIFTTIVDREDNLWIGTRNSGLFLYDNRSKEITQWSTGSKNPMLRDNYITTLFEDSKSRIWIGTNNYGLQYLDYNTFSIKNITKELGTICSINEDAYGKLWVTTSSGLYQINIDTDEIISYSVDDGLPTNQFNFSSTIRASNGLLYFGSVNGLISFDPNEINVKEKVCNVYLESLEINDSKVTVSTPNTPLLDQINKVEELVLTNVQSRSFNINYTAISLQNSNSIHYQVRLLGISNAWRDVGLDRKFVGSNLPSGTYILQIRANSSTTNWEDAPIKSLKIRILPPFYRSVLAYVIYFILLVIVAYCIFKFLLFRMQERNKIKLTNLEKEQIEKINAMKIDFFTIVSHELRTPLSLIIASLKLINKKADLAEPYVETMRSAIKSSDKMVELIDELITFNKIDSGNSQTFVQKGNPLDFLDSIVDLFVPKALEKEISIFVSCENNGEEVWFSPSYVEKIINNLLSNAIKFTPTKGEISVRAAIVENTDKNIYLRIDVKDSGIGIAPEEINNIFSDYYQTKRGHNASAKGWGIGLALTRKLVEAHKGFISVVSNLQEGSCFSVLLNVSEDSFEDNQKISAEKTVVPILHYEYSMPHLIHCDSNMADDNRRLALSLNPQTILLVEDNEELINFLRNILIDKYRVLIAMNGVEALNVCLREPIDLIISDVMMPIMDGIELCKKIKNDISTSHIPVILLTAKTSTNDIIEGYSSGADAYVQKPFDPNILELQIQNILKIKQTQREEIISQMGQENLTSSLLNEKDQEFITSINELIDNNIENECFSVVDVTKGLGVSRSVLHIKMRSLLDTSMGEYIRKKRLDKASLLLKAGYNVSETAYKTGFSDPKYFSKCFKKEFGVSPSEYVKY